MDEPQPDNPDQNPENGPSFIPQPSQESKPESKPPVPPSPKAFDIFSPGKTTPSASARPIIVSHKAMAKDTTVTGNQEVIKQDNKEAGAPTVEHAQLLDTRKKINLRPVGDVAGVLQGDEHHDDNPDPEQQVPAEAMPPNPPEYDHPLESKPPAQHEQALDEQAEKPPETQPSEPEAKSEEPAPAFSPPEHTDTAGVPAPTHEDEELLIPAHTGEGYNAPIQASDEQFNQFVVSHHKSARQKTLKKVAIIVLVVIVIGAAIGLVFWKLK